MKNNRSFIKFFEGKEFTIILNIFSRSFFPSFHVVCSGIIFIGVIYLSNDHIKCYDKSRLLYAGSVNTIFFDKTGTLSEKNLEIGGFFPLSVTPNNMEISLKFYNINRLKEFNTILIDYYTQYQKDELNNLKKNNARESFINTQFNEKMKEKKLDLIPKRLMALFMECMVSCNTLEKKNNQLAGNSIEK